MDLIEPDGSHAKTSLYTHGSLISKATSLHCALRFALGMNCIFGSVNKRGVPYPIFPQ